MLRIGLVAVGVLAAVPALAADFSNADPAPTAGDRGISAYLDVGGGYTWYAPGGGEASDWDVQGRINFWLGPRTSVQFDAWDEELQYIGDGENRFYGGAAHLSWRDPSSLLLGGMVSIGNSFAFDYAAAAFEVQRYLGNWTLYAQAGYSWSFNTAATQTAPYAQLVARYFLNPDLMIEGQGGYSWYGVEGGGPGVGVYRFQAQVERKLPGMPLAGFLAYQVNLFTATGGNATQQSVIAGLKLLTADSLLSLDRNGPGLLDLNPLFGYPIWR